jgi:hypothetical protein
MVAVEGNEGGNAASEVGLLHGAAVEGYASGCCRGEDERGAVAAVEVFDGEGGGTGEPIWP